MWWIIFWMSTINSDECGYLHCKHMKNKLNAEKAVRKWQFLIALGGLPVADANSRELQL